jgi:hypothetical protein
MCRSFGSLTFETLNNLLDRSYTRLQKWNILLSVSGCGAIKQELRYGISALANAFVGVRGPNDRLYGVGFD